MSLSATNGSTPGTMLRTMPATNASNAPRASIISDQLEPFGLLSGDPGYDRATTRWAARTASSPTTRSTAGPPALPRSKLDVPCSAKTMTAPIATVVISAPARKEESRSAGRGALIAARTMAKSVGQIEDAAANRKISSTALHASLHRARLCSSRRLLRASSPHALTRCGGELRDAARVHVSAAKKSDSVMRMNLDARQLRPEDAPQLRAWFEIQTRRDGSVTRTIHPYCPN